MHFFLNVVRYVFKTLVLINVLVECFDKQAKTIA